MTDFEIRSDGSMLIKGYVNAVGRDSRPIMTSEGRAVEQIEPGAFAESLKSRSAVDVLFNHNPQRRLASTSDGTAKLYEDSIGLRAEVIVSDKEVVDKAKSGMLSGWSFGFYNRGSELEKRSSDIPRRHIQHLDMYEVSLIDGAMLPCYAGTSVELRADGKVPEYRAEFDDFTLLNDYCEERAYFNTYMLNARINACFDELELRYNPYHDRETAELQRERAAEII